MVWYHCVLSSIVALTFVSRYPTMTCLIKSCHIYRNPLRLRFMPPRSGLNCSPLLGRLLTGYISTINIDFLPFNFHTRRTMWAFTLDSTRMAQLLGEGAISYKFFKEDTTQSLKYEGFSIKGISV